MTASSLRILVTGATGALGRRVVGRLLAEGHTIRILTRRPFAAERLFANAVEAVEWHPLSGTVPDTALTDLDAIVHLAGEPFAGAADADRRRRMRTSRLRLAERLAVAARNAGLRLVVTSVVLPAFGKSSGEVMTDQSPRSPPTTDFERDILDVEAACNALGSGGASLAIVRLGILLEAGPLLRDLVRLSQRGQIPHMAGTLIPAIDPDDAAALLTGLIAHRDMAGPLIGVAPEPLKGEFLQTALGHYNKLPLGLPAPAARVERRVGPLAHLLYNRTRIVPQRLLDAGAGFKNADLEASLTRALAAMSDVQPAQPAVGSRLIARLRPRAAK